MSSKPNEGQQRVLDAKGNILVNASAGSGKTSIMIDKIMQLLSEGKDIRKILVMTFTVAAASEMKVRLVKKIYNEIRQNNSKSSILLHQLNNIPFGNICTIDSFCYGIFQKYFALIKRDPSCVMLDPSEGAIIIDEIIDSVCEEYITDNDQQFLTLSRHLSQSRKLDELKNIVVMLNNYLSSQNSTETFIKEVLLNEENTKRNVTDYFKEYFYRRVATLIDNTYVYLQKVKAENILSEFEQAGNILKQLLVAQNTPDIEDAMYALDLACIASTVKKYTGINIKEDIIGYYTLLKEAKEEFKNYYDSYKLQNNYCNDENKKLIEVVLKVRDSYLSYKVKRNLVDFGDLKYYTLKIMDNEAAREEIKASFDYIFVDEYQDTDNLQEAMLKAICKDDNVFVVGDMKQAIYRFRYAEPKIFNSRMRVYENLHNGENIPLSINYRSDKRILNFVNQVCNEIMTLDFCDIDYKKDGALFAGKDFGEVSVEPACSIYTYINDTVKAKKYGYYSVKEDNTEEETQIEGEFIAKKIRELIFVNISDGDGKTRKAEYKDMAILVRNRSILKRIFGGLDKADIPYNLDGDTIEKDVDREVLVDFLRLLTNMAQDIPLGNVLMSRMFDFELSELLQIQKENPKPTFWEAFTTFSGNQNITDKIQNFLNSLEEYRFKASYMKVSDLLVDVMAKGFDGYLLSKGKRAIENINSFVHFITGKPADESVEDFIYFYENTYKGNKVSCENNAVTITTIHKSKGLEYPVVFLAGCDAKAVGGGNQSAPKVLCDKDLGIAVKRFDDDNYSATETFATLVYRLKALQEERQEMARLLYVALTRASNHIYITGKIAKEEKTKDLFKANSFMDLLLYVKQNNGAFASYWNDITLNDIIIKEPALKIKDEPEEINLQNLDIEYPYDTSTRSHAKYSVTELLHNESSDVKKLFAASDIDTGIGYHTVMQYIDYNATDTESIIAEIARLVESKLLTAEIAKALDTQTIKRIMNNDIMKLARRSKCLREQPFMLYTDCIDGHNKLTDKVLVQGVIDLLIVGETVILVDFKASFGDPKYIKEKYSRQLEIYAQAVEKVFKLKVDKKILINIIKDFAVEL